MTEKRLLIVAGEASGDLHGASLVRNLKKLAPELRIAGIAGKHMAQAGVEVLYDVNDLAVIGFAEVVKNIRKLKRVFAGLCCALDELRPDAVILIDYPGFNLRFAAEAKKRGIRVIYYISPQVWAWAGGRVEKIKSLVDHMLVVFLFEKEIYEKKRVMVDFVGHPLLDIVKPDLTRSDAACTFSLSLEHPVIGLLPGSRRQEVLSLLPVMLRAARIIHDSFPSVQFILACAPTVSSRLVDKLINRSGLAVKLVEGRTYDVINLADLLLVASGTATLETACLSKPMVIVYKVSFLTWLIVRRLIRIDSIGLVNVVAGKKVVPELLQFDATPKKIARTALSLLNDPVKYDQVVEELAEIRKRLGEQGASKRAAKLVWDDLQREVVNGRETDIT